MDRESLKTLRRIERNDAQVTELCIGYSGNDGGDLHQVMLVIMQDLVQLSGIIFTWKY